MRLIVQLDDWVLCRIYHKKGEAIPGRRSSAAAAAVEPKREAPEAAATDFLYLDDATESLPRLVGECSSVSEHAVEWKCEREVQSLPRWGETDWERALGFGANYEYGNPLLLQEDDIFSYMRNPF